MELLENDFTVTVTRKYLQLGSLASAGTGDFQSHRKPTGFQPVVV